MAGAAITARTSRKRAQQVGFGEELKIVALPHRAGLHKVLLGLAGKAGAHEDVENVVHKRFRIGEGEARMGCKGARQVGMAAIMIFVVIQQRVRIGVTASPDHIVHATAKFVVAIPIQRVVSNDGQ